jgi:hypothetical protein
MLIYLLITVPFYTVFDPVIVAVELPIHHYAIER